jgi:hypothetical protein
VAWYDRPMSRRKLIGPHTAIGAVPTAGIVVLGTANGRSTTEIAICAGLAATLVTLIGILPNTELRWLRGLEAGVIAGALFVCFDLQWSSYTLAHGAFSFVWFGTVMGVLSTRERQPLS